MLLPWSTDAPVYHRPWGTGALILANLIGHIIRNQLDDDTLKAWILAFGDGLHPLQWLTSDFLHANVLHLIGNMIFLWVFGLVVEGKLGWRRFVPIYLALCVTENLIEQTAMLGANGGSALGASGVINALMVMSLVWAPENLVSCLLFIWIVPKSFDAPMVVICGLFLGWDVLMAAADSFAMGTSLMHLIGAALGALVGIVMVKRKWVDCEGWDIFARARKWTSLAADAPAPRGVAASGDPLARQREIAQQREAALMLLRDHCAGGEAALAKRVYDETARTTGTWPLERSDLALLCDGLLAERAWTEAKPLLVDHLARFPDASTAQRLDLAAGLVDHDRRPAKALELLAPLDHHQLSEAQREQKSSIIAAAQALIAQGVMEIDD